MNAQHRIFTGSSLVLVLWPKQHIPNELDVDKWSVEKIGNNATNCGSFFGLHRYQPHKFKSQPSRFYLAPRRILLQNRYINSVSSGITDSKKYRVLLKIVQIF
jgi:hypothetical protein